MDLKPLLQQALTSTQVDHIDADLVHSDHVRDQLEAIEAKAKIVEEIGKFTRADDVLAHSCPDAAKRLVMEMHFGKTSADRTRAAESIINRVQGKPVDRVMNINMNASEMTDNEVDNTIKELNAELGYTLKAGNSAPLLIDSEGGERQKQA